MKTIFQLRKLGRRIPRRLRNAKAALERATAPKAVKAAHGQVVRLEAQQRAFNTVATHIATRRPYRDATPHKKRKPVIQLPTATTGAAPVPIATGSERNAA